MTQFSVGIVGCGLISAAHLSAWQRTPGFRVRGVLDTNLEQAKKRAGEFGVETVYDRLDQLVEECDIVDVCTPPQSHAAIAEQAIARKRHLVMEKPVVTKLADWERMAAKVTEAKCKLAVIHNAKFLHSIQLAKRWVDAGRIGEVIRVHREFLTHESTDRMLVGDKHWSHKLPGGRWFETLPHELYLTHWFAGPLEVANVTAIRTPTAPPGTSADEILVTLSGGHTIASFQFSANCRENRRTLTLQGTTGRIVVDMLSDFATLSTLQDSKIRRAVGRSIVEAGGALLQAVPDRGRYGLQRLRKESPHLRIIQSLGRNLQGQGDEPTPFAEVDYVIRNCDRIGREIDRQVGFTRA
ncbi:MAG TPA: Gfo/Idh/MocA family oxidoreductase [Acidimicrobiia bacterium]|jgi:predicted dehydrogenase|nr:Gfo/Idh/MocA family oxidoreductase [Acidimicrobiia bacterium]